MKWKKRRSLEREGQGNREAKVLDENISVVNLTEVDKRGYAGKKMEI